jgi:hypothetical protein
MTNREQVDRLWDSKWTVACPRGRKATLLAAGYRKNSPRFDSLTLPNGKPLAKSQRELIECSADLEDLAEREAQLPPQVNRMLFWAIDRSAVADGVAVEATGSGRSHYDDVELADFHPDDGDIQIALLSLTKKIGSVEPLVHFGLADWSEPQTLSIEGVRKIRLPNDDGVLDVEIDKNEEGCLLKLRGHRMPKQEFIVRMDGSHSLMISVILRRMMNEGRTIAWKISTNRVRVWTSLMESVPMPIKIKAGTGLLGFL